MIKRCKGCHDIYGKEGMVWLYINEVIESLMEKYNYEFIRTPIFESSDLFHRGIGDSTDIVTKETYDFKDRGDRNITLRPEGTAGVVRSFIENKMYGENLPKKLWYNGTMYRYERPQSGRDRELTQFGVEVLGSDDPIVDAEVISIPVMLYKLLGLSEIKVNINTLGDNESRDNYRKALVDYFTPHIEELCEDCQVRIKKNPLRILDCKVDCDLDIMKNAPKTIDYLNEESKERFELVKKYLTEMGIEYVVNPSIVRGLDYYNHTVFEIEAKVEGFGSQNVLGAGGRYNGLVEQLDGPKTCGVGFATGIGRLAMALELEEVDLPIKEGIDAFVMYVNEEEKTFASKLVQDLRMNGYRVDTEYTSRSLKAQFKQADRLATKYYIILNSEDIKNHQVKVKNASTKSEELVDIDYIIYYLDEALKYSDDYMTYDNIGVDDGCHCENDCQCDDDCHCGDDCHCHHCDCDHGKE